MIYRLWPDYSYPGFKLDSEQMETRFKEDDQFELMTHDIKPYSSRWQKVDGYYSDPENFNKQASAKAPNVVVNYGRLILDKTAQLALKRLIEPSGEWLQVNTLNGNATIFNVLDSVDNSVIVKGSEVFDENDTDFLVGFRFEESDLNNKVLFRAEISDYACLYCTEHFKLAIDEAGLRGVCFAEGYGYPFLNES